MQGEQAAASDEEAHLVLGVTMLVKKFGAQLVLLRMIPGHTDDIDGHVAALGHQPIDLRPVGGDHVLLAGAGGDRCAGVPALQLHADLGQGRGDVLEMGQDLERLLGAGFVIDTEDTHVRLSEGSPGRSLPARQKFICCAGRASSVAKELERLDLTQRVARLLAPGVQTRGRGSASRRNSGAGQARVAAWKPALRGGHARSSCKRKAMITAAASAARLAMANDQPGPSPDQAYPAYNAPSAPPIPDRLAYSACP